MDYLEQFRTSLKWADEEPERLALSLAVPAFPELDVTAEMARIDALADQMQQQLPPHARGEDLAVRIMGIFVREMGFVGNRQDYYDPRNSYLNQVIHRRTGLPITLALLLSAIARRLGVHLAGMGYPAHFMLKYEDAQGCWILDPFNADVLEPDEIGPHLAHLFGQRMELGPMSQYGPLSGLEWIQRILNNLRHLYGRHDDPNRLRQVLDFMLILQPNQPDLWRERGVSHYMTASYLAARRDLRRYLFLKGIMANQIVPLGTTTLPGSPFQAQSEVNPEITQILVDIDQKLARLN